MTLLGSCLLLSSCALFQKPPPQGPPPTPPGAFQLLAETGPFPTEVLRTGDRREDLEIRPTNFDLVPSVVATGESPELVIGPNTRVSLAGDAEGKTGWNVDNVLFFEMKNKQGQIINRFAVGFVTGQLYMGPELIDNVGSWSPRHAPKTPDLSPRFPSGKPVTVSVTVLDNGNAGGVSDVFLILEERTESTPELRETWDAPPEG